MPDRFQEKIYTLKDLQKLCAIWRFKSDKIVFTNGCFDLIHRGHLYLLNEAAKLGDRLIVAINSNDSVKAIKGAGRPIVPQEERAYHLACFQMVDAIIIFNELTPLSLVKTLQPDLLVKGGDYDKADVVGAKEVLKNNGNVHIVPLLDKYSTTGRLSKLH